MATDDEDVTGRGRGDSSPESGGDLYARMEAERQVAREASERKSEERRPYISMVRFIGVVSLTVLAVSCGINSMVGASDHQKKVAANSARITELNAALSTSGNEIENLPTIDTLAPDFDQAMEAAEDLAALQNEMAGLEVTQGDKDGLRRYGALVDEAKPLFAPGDTSGGGFLPQGQWYQPYEPGTNEEGDKAWVPMASDTWGWELKEINDIDRKGHVTVLWQADFTSGRGSGEMLAWVTGHYDPSRDHFYDLILGLTHEGFSRLGATTSPEAFGSGAGSNPLEQNRRSRSGELEPAPDAKDLIDEAQRSQPDRPSSTKRPSSGRGSVDDDDDDDDPLDDDLDSLDDRKED